MMRRSLRFLAVVSLVATLFPAAAVRAQTASLYVVSANTQLTNVYTGAIGTNNNYQNQYTTFWTSGVGGGLSFNFIPIGPVAIGMDLRGSTRPGTVGSDSFSLGPRIQIKPPLIRIKPYIEATGGYIATRTVNVTAQSSTSPAVGGTLSSNYAGWQVIGGIDYPLIHFLDIRVIEIGGGKAYTVDTGQLLNGQFSYSQISTFSINSGIVLHF